MVSDNCAESVKNKEYLEFFCWLVTNWKNHTHPKDNWDSIATRPYLNIPALNDQKSAKDNILESIDRFTEHF